MSRSFFYPPGREKQGALGALDLALWDIRGKVLKLPVHQILGGMTRNFCECYNTGGAVPASGPAWGLRTAPPSPWPPVFRAFRMGAADTPANTTYNTREKVNQVYRDCVEAREGVGKNGDWCIDFHQRFDLIDAVRGCDLIEGLAPLFVEDPVRAEGFNDDLPKIRKMVNGPHRGGRRVGRPLGFQPPRREP